MKFFISWIIVALALQQSVFSTPPERLFYRIVAETNTAIIGWTAELDLTWTNWTTNISYTIQATSDLGNGLTSFWGTVESGQATNLIMTSRAPKPDSPFPPTNSTLLIPAGIFLMGDSYNSDAYAEDVPAHPVRTGAFYMDPTEVTLEKWDEVVNWATNNGYSFEGTAAGIGTNYPITTMSWYDCVKWCNARSQKEGFTPVYFSDETHTTLFKEGTNDLGAANVNWKGNGYRLPTEAEWEKAARGGLTQNYYPWVSPGPTNPVSIYLDPTNANYDLTGIGTTTAVAFFPSNNFSLFDMAGNVSEWCWDWYVAYQDSFLIDPTGPTNGTRRVTRGGSYASDFSPVRCSDRNDNKFPFTIDDPKIGFRCVRSCP